MATRKFSEAFDNASMRNIASSVWCFLLVFILSLIGFRGSLASADEGHFEGSLSIESRIFEDDDLEITLDQTLALLARVDWTTRKKPWFSSVRVWSQASAIDNKRNMAFPEQVSIGYQKGLVQLLAGFLTFNWSAMKTFHPADILNARNFDTHIENPQKIGEPAVQLSIQGNSTSLELIYLPANLSPWGPSKHSRKSHFPPGVLPVGVLWLTPQGTLSTSHFRHQWAARLVQSLGPVKVDVHVVQHQDRIQPTFVIDPLSFEIQTIFLPVTQIGGTYLHRIQGLSFRLEGAHRMFSKEITSPLYGPIMQANHSWAALGLEYNRPLFGKSVATLYLEGQSLFNATEIQRNGLHIFQRDITVGYEQEFNDSAERSFLMSFIFDVERRNEYLWTLAYSQLLWGRLRIEGVLRVFDAPQKGIVPVGLEVMRNSDHLQLSLTQSF